MNTHDIEQERRKFEAFMRDKNPNHDLVHEYGIYRFSPVQRHWDAWRAAIEADRQRRGEPVAVVSGDEDGGMYAELVMNHGLVPGQELYAAPQPAEPVVWPPAFPPQIRYALEFYADGCVRYPGTRPVIEEYEQSPDWEQHGEDYRSCPRFIATYNRADDALTALNEWEANPPQPAEPVNVPSDDTIYLGCARMGLTGASDEEVLSYVRLARRQAPDLPANKHRPNASIEPRLDTLPVTPQEDEAWADLERRQ